MKHKIISYLLLLAGWGVIIAVFFSFLRDILEAKLFYLNLIVSCLVYAIICFGALDILVPIQKSADENIGYGIKWYGIWVYVPIAVGLIIASIYYQLGFKFCVIVHIALLIFLSMSYLLASISSQNNREVESHLVNRRAGLQQIIHGLDLLDVQCMSKVNQTYYDSVKKLRDEVLFITPSNSPLARQLENKISDNIEAIVAHLEMNSPDDEWVTNEFEKCFQLLNLRKQHK